MVTAERITPENDPTFLRWAGSKKQQLRTLLERCPNKYGTYLEPFAGSARLFFRLKPKRAVLSDINPSLIAMYQQIQSNPGEVWRELISLPKGEDPYYHLRDEFNCSSSTPRKAAILIYLNRFCFNGLYRTDLNGKFNVPYGGKRNGQLPRREHLLRVAELLQNVDLRQGDFEETVMPNARSGDFVYLDPPFISQHRRAVQYYGRQTFSSIDVDRLLQILEELDRRGVHFMVSYSDSPASNRHFERWNVERLAIMRNIAGFSGSRRGAYELLVTNKQRN